MHKKQLILFAGAIAFVATGACEKESKVVNKDQPATKTPAPSAAKPATPAAPHAGVPKSPHGGTAPHAGGMGMGMTQKAVASPTAADGTKVMGSFSMKVPKAWRESTPASTMRAAQFKMGDAKAEAELVVYYFGSGGAGGLQANLDRWYSQFKQADGSASKDKAKTATKEIAGFKVTTTDVSGTYVAAMQPGASEKHNKAEQRMLAAIVESPSGPYYFKLIGPGKTVAASKKDFDTFVASIKKAGDAPVKAPETTPATKSGASKTGATKSAPKKSAPAKATPAKKAPAKAGDEKADGEGGW